MLSPLILLYYLLTYIPAVAVCSPGDSAAQRHHSTDAVWRMLVVPGKRSVDGQVDGPLRSLAEQLVSETLGDLTPPAEDAQIDEVRALDSHLGRLLLRILLADVAKFREIAAAHLQLSDQTAHNTDSDTRADTDSVSPSDSEQPPPDAASDSDAKFQRTRRDPNLQFRSPKQLSGRAKRDAALLGDAAEESSSQSDRQKRNLQLRSENLQAARGAHQNLQAPFAQSLHRSARLIGERRSRPANERSAEAASRANQKQQSGAHAQLWHLMAKLLKVRQALTSSV